VDRLHVVPHSVPRSSCGRPRADAHRT
jgi:hypothetical protein